MVPPLDGDPIRFTTENKEPGKEHVDELHEIAADYFNEFEGRHLYPSLWSFWPICMVVSILMNVAFFIFGLITHITSDWITGALILSSFGCYARLAALASGKLKLEFGGDLNRARSRRLEELTGRPSTEFAKLAHEAIDLVMLDEAISPRPFNAMKWVYRRDMSNQLAALSVSLVAVIIAISPKTFTLEPDIFFMLIESQGLWNLAIVILFIIGMLYIIGMGLAYAFNEAMEWFPRFRAMWTPLTKRSPARVNYMVRHLVRYHHFAAGHRRLGLSVRPPR